MKKIIFSLGLLFMTSLTFAEDNLVVPTVKTVNTLQSKVENEELDLLVIKMKLMFGRASRDCQGWGVCYIELEFDSGLEVLESSYGNNRELVLKYDVAFEREVNSHYGRSVIVVEEPFALSEEVNNALGVQNFVIGVGEYHLQNGLVVFRNEM